MGVRHKKRYKDTDERTEMETDQRRRRILREKPEAMQSCRSTIMLQTEFVMNIQIKKNDDMTEKAYKGDEGR